MVLGNEKLEFRAYQEEETKDITQTFRVFFFFKSFFFLKLFPMGEQEKGGWGLFYNSCGFIVSNASINEFKPKPVYAQTRLAQPAPPDPLQCVESITTLLSPHRFGRS